MSKVYIYGLGYQESAELKIVMNKIHPSGKHVPDFTNIQYIGRAVDPIARLRAHISDGWKSQNCRKTMWIYQNFLQFGYVPFMRIYTSCDFEKRHRIENWYINELRKTIGKYCVNGRTTATTNFATLDEVVIQYLEYVHEEDEENEPKIIA